MVTIVAFDVDGTLINDDDTPNYPVIEILQLLKRMGCTIVVWSGSGGDYAERWADKLGLPYDAILPKQAIADTGSQWKQILRPGPVDLAFDDEDTEGLALVNIRVPWVNVDNRIA